MKQVGSGFKQTSRALRRDPQFGDQVIETFRGDFNTLQLKADLLRSQGLRTELDRVNGLSTLTVYGSQADVGSEVPVDRWEIDTITRDLGLFEHPFVFKTFEGYNAEPIFTNRLSAAGGSDVITSAPTSFFTAVGNNQLVIDLWSLLNGGITTFPARITTLIRERSYSIGYPTRIAIPTYSTSAWTTSQLNTVFSVPSAVQSQLPADPAADHTPTNTTWSWRLTADRMNYDRTRNVIEESRMWEFWYWPNQLYNIVS